MNEARPITEADIRAALDGTWMRWMTNLEEFQLVPVSVNFMGQYGPKGRPERDARRRHREGNRRGGLATAAKMRALRMEREQQAEASQ